MFLKLAADGKDARWIANQLDIGWYRVECELWDERPATSDPIGRRDVGRRLSADHDTIGDTPDSMGTHADERPATPPPRQQDRPDDALVRIRDGFGCQNAISASHPPALEAGMGSGKPEMTP